MNVKCLSFLFVSILCFGCSAPSESNYGVPNEIWNTMGETEKEANLKVYLANQEERAADARYRAAQEERQLLKEKEWNSRNI